MATTRIITESGSCYSNSTEHSSIRCRNVNVTSVGTTGLVAGVMHLGRGTVIDVRSGGGKSCPAVKSTTVTNSNKGDVIRIVSTTEGLCSNECQHPSASEEVQGSGIHVSSSIVCTGDLDVNVSKVRTEEVETRCTHRRTSPGKERRISAHSDFYCSQSNHHHHHHQHSSTGNNVITNQMMIFCANNLSSDWRTLGSQLGFSFEKLDQLCLDHGHLGRKEPCYQMLNTWKQRQGRMATREALMEALDAIDRKDIALRLP